MGPTGTLVLLQPRSATVGFSAQRSSSKGPAGVGPALHQREVCRSHNCPNRLFLGTVTVGVRGGTHGEGVSTKITRKCCADEGRNFRPFFSVRERERELVQEANKNIMTQHLISVPHNFQVLTAASL